MHAQIRTLVLTLTAAIILGAPSVHADGVMRPAAKSYPKDFLRHRMTNIDVTFHGQIAVTTVYQEFVNEWYLPTDAVYSFPLPADARATDFLFWSNDTLFRAPLKVKEQAPNPGSGEGGVDALLTNYLGSNAIRILINGIRPGETQRVILKFISLCRYDRGKIEYRYPLNTDLFVTYPLDDLSATFHVNATDDITGFDVSGMQDPQIRQTDSRHAEVAVRSSKVYLTKDLVFSFTAPSSVLGHDLYASRTVSRGGHFVLMLKSPQTADSTVTLPKNVVFLLDRSTAAAGTPLQLSKDAILECLDLLTARDHFNVIAFNSSVQTFRYQSVPATASARDSAKAFLTALTSSGTPAFGAALSVALSRFTADSLNKAMIVFSDGMALTAPDAVKGWNTADVAVFPVAISLNPSTARLETMAYQNFGFPLFLKPTDPVVSNVRWLFDQVSAPIIKDTRMEMGPNAFDLFPRDLHTVYAGSRFFLTGRYTTAGSTGLTIAGQSKGGPTIYSTMLAFPADSTDANFVESLWAKEKIDFLERRITLSGATDSLKKLLISISLSYGIRCQYTAYVADKTQPMTDVGETAVTLTSFTAEANGDGVTLSWGIRNTAHVREVHLYRADRADGEYRRIASDLSGVMTFLDREGDVHMSWYKLEVITLEGERILSDPIPADAQDVPYRTTLLQNYPNPFNPSTSIGYQVEGSAPVHVSIIVYDLLGREVCSLVDASRTRGGYRVQWDGRDRNGTTASAGAYICRLRAGTAVSTRTMLLLR
jgi:Ca-activated chloride channel homolog